MKYVTRLNVKQCKEWAKRLKNFLKINGGEAILYKNENGIKICASTQAERIAYESKFYESIYYVGEYENLTIEQISYELYEYTHKMMTFTEAAERWGLDDSTLRKLVKTDKVKENIDYGKSGNTWLINVKAMERIYGEEPKNK